MCANMTTVRIVIVDDHPVVREGLKTYLDLQDDMTVVGEAGTVREALDVIQAAAPDLILLDLKLPDENGLALMRRLQPLDKRPKVLVLTSFLDEDYVREALRLGASGYRVKHAAPAALVDSIRAAVRGELPLDPGAVGFLTEARNDPLDQLTARERQVLGLLGQGLSNKAIGRELGVAEKTVKTHVSSVLNKLGIRDRVKAALFARDRKL